MKVLFDNNVPAPLRRHLKGHEVRTAHKMGWHELENGDLLKAAEQGGFEVMVTGDKNLSYQQNLEGRKLALVVLPTIDWTALKRAACNAFGDSRCGKSGGAGKFRTGRVTSRSVGEPRNLEP